VPCRGSGHGCVRDDCACAPCPRHQNGSDGADCPDCSADSDCPAADCRDYGSAGPAGACSPPEQTSPPERTSQPEQTSPPLGPWPPALLSVQPSPRPEALPWPAAACSPERRRALL